MRYANLYSTLALHPERPGRLFQILSSASLPSNWRARELARPQEKPRRDRNRGWMDGATRRNRG